MKGTSSQSQFCPFPCNQFESNKNQNSQITIKVSDKFLDKIIIEKHAVLNRITKLKKIIKRI